MELFLDLTSVLRLRRVHRRANTNLTSNVVLANLMRTNSQFLDLENPFLKLSDPISFILSTTGLGSFVDKGQSERKRK